ncbi:MAG: DNA mismatch endonuclease Vsr [Deltaproteobacteria bacterium]|nr:DNA mismatch endonuclease Vsr [Deltaproteobacteria bacterium]
MDRISKEQRSSNMRAVRGKNTQPELIVRRMAHRLGFRFRLHGAGLPGKPDLVFAGRRKVVFVHGCFWHQHAAKSCRKAKTPRSNEEFWHSKLARNVKRDSENIKLLRTGGWDVLVLWECQIGDTGWLERRLRKFLELPGSD